MSKMKRKRKSIKQGQTLYSICEAIQNWDEGGADRPTISEFRIMSNKYKRKPLGEVDMNMTVDFAKKTFIRNGAIRRSVFFSKKKAKKYMSTMTPFFEKLRGGVYWPPGEIKCKFAYRKTEVING